MNGRKESFCFLRQAKKLFTQPKEQMRPVPPSGGEKAQEQGRELAAKKIKTIERDKKERSRQGELRNRL
ncbi:hypothetical protein [[Ruminococcus] lactaris]|uniref:hypothetical protein n=1 Tax=[Ruminococcus] lactaris TaxID=46228 RepID=UPI00242C18ED|nr:hypothetical protein [[Ruminococcus] lactaris]